MLRLYSDSQGLELVCEIFDRSIATYMCGHLQDWCDCTSDVLVVSLLSWKLASAYASRKCLEYLGTCLQSLPALILITSSLRIHLGMGAGQTYSGSKYAKVLISRQLMATFCFPLVVPLLLLLCPGGLGAKGFTGTKTFADIPDHSEAMLRQWNSEGAAPQEKACIPNSPSLWFPSQCSVWHLGPLPHYRWIFQSSTTDFDNTWTLIQINPVRLSEGCVGDDFHQQL